MMSATDSEEESYLYITEADQLLDAGAESTRNGRKNGTAKKKTKKSYPYSVFFILSNEFCERFSYYGMRAILVLYLTRWLKFERDRATSIFHAFSMMCYLLPLFGAILADGYLGKFKTILYLSWFYFVGNLIVSTTAVPPPEWVGPAIGLLFIAIGTGGIKSCVAPFGADQFVKGQEKERISFFSAFYFMINLGSTISILLTPILRADVQCFGQECYALAFGVPAVLMLISVLVFMAGGRLYKKVPPCGDVIGKTFKCIFFGLVGKFKRRKLEEKKSHWLYYADDRFEGEFIEDVRLLLKVLLMFGPLPLFWALSDQQGSRWTLQAEQMNGDMGIFGTLKPDQLQALNPILILLLIPLFDKVIYPVLDRCHIPNRPLQRMVVGLYISASAFVVAGVVQIKLESLSELSLSSTEVGVTMINTLPCEAYVQSSFYTGPVPSQTVSGFVRHSPGNTDIAVKSACTPGAVNSSFLFTEATAYRVVFSQDQQQLQVQQFIDRRKKTKTGNALVSVYSSLVMPIKLVAEKFQGTVTNKTGTDFQLHKFSATNFTALEPDSYLVYIPVPAWSPGSNTTAWASTGPPLKLGYGGIYTAYIYGNTTQVSVTLFSSVRENTLGMVWMVPQYVLITVGEVLFSISGLAFAYSQAPHSLKSVVQAVWLLTVSFGDLMVIIVANIKAIPSQSAEYFLFAGLMAVDTVIFMVMSIFYTYKPNSLYVEDLDTDDQAGLIQPDTSEEIPLQSHRKQEKQQ